MPGVTLLAPSRPSSRPCSPRLEVAIFLAGLVFSGFTLLRGIAPHDEGLMLQWASRITAGQWPYRDFWCNYGPGQPLVLAGLFKLFGPSLLSWRVLRVIVDAVVAVLAFRLVRRQAGAGWALAAGVASLGAMAFPSGPGPNPTALALALGALVAVPRRPGVAGGLAGLASLARPELGVAAAIGAGLSLVGELEGRGPRRGAFVRLLVAFGVVALICWIPFVIVAPSQLAHQLVGFYGLQHLQRLPFPLDFDGPVRPSKLIEYYIPLILVVGLAAWAAVTAIRRPPVRLLAAAPLALVGLAYLLGRTDEFHLSPLAAVLPILLATAAAREPALVARVGLGVALALVLAHGLDRRAGELLHPPRQVPLRVDVADGVRVAPADAHALERLVRYVRRRVPPGAPVFVADPRSDLVRVGDTLLYVLLQRPNATRYDTMQPGVITTARVQREIVAELGRAHVRLVVRWLDLTADRPEPNGAGRSSGVRILDRYLARAYRPVVRFGAYLVLARRHA